MRQRRGGRVRGEMDGRTAGARELLVWELDSDGWPGRFRAFRVDGVKVARSSSSCRRSTVMLFALPARISPLLTVKT